MSYGEFREVKIAVGGGGSGPETIEDALLEQTPNIVSIAPATDNGGHTKEIRSTLNLPATGDVSRRLAIHIRNNPLVRELQTYRFSENGQRQSNTQLAAAIRIAGSFEGGVQLIEDAYTAWYVGRVVPVTTDNVHLKIDYSDGSYVIGEEHLDQRRSDEPSVSRISYVCEDPPSSGIFHDCQPKASHSAIDAILESDAYVVAPGSWHGSIRALHDVDGVYQAMKETKAKLVLIANAVDFAGWTVPRYAEELTDRIGRKFDLILADAPKYHLPKSYSEGENLHFVRCQQTKTMKFTDQLKRAPFTRLHRIDGKPTIRHDGQETAAPILQLAQYARDQRRLIVSAA